MARRVEQRWEYSFELRDSRERKPAGPPCPGGCNSRWRRVQELLTAYEAQLATWQEAPTGNPPAEPEVSEVRPWLGDPVLCQRCQSQTRQELGELSDLAAVLDAENTGFRHGPDAERVRGSKHAPSPSAIVEDLDELAHVLRGWQTVAMNAEDIPPRAGYLMTELDTLTKRLASIYFTRLMGDQSVAADFAHEIRSWHRRLTAEAKAGTGTHQKRAPCPRCERFSLFWRDGDRYVGCRTPVCGRMLSLDEYADWESAWLGSGAPTTAALCAAAR